MAQYIPFDPAVEVNGRTILAFVNAIPAYRDTMLSILAQHQLPNVEPNGWYPQIYWLNAFRTIGENFGDNTLFSVGKAIPENAAFPPEINDLKSALASIDVAYHMNHRNGEIGYYKLVSFDEKSKTAVMECRNPYPSEFDRGIITAMARKFKPAFSIVNVSLDHHKPTRKNGAMECTYIVKW
ncbi:hypothetical protein [Rhodoflexus caldus]|uniref:hypothetical protein n=1 Tax=Rhodoflexus caldus TaxID=2891236 RepID=UPI00202AACD4|nr:hypothetical protein [Rhodoflexus caldus]